MFILFLCIAWVFVFGISPPSCLTLSFDIALTKYHLPFLGVSHNARATGPGGCAPHLSGKVLEDSLGVGVAYSLVSALLLVHYVSGVALVLVGNSYPWMYGG